jgi:hypothetical protein
MGTPESITESEMRKNLSLRVLQTTKMTMNLVIRRAEQTVMLQYEALSTQRG